MFSAAYLFPGSGKSVAKSRNEMPETRSSSQKSVDQRKVQARPPVFLMAPEQVPPLIASASPESQSSATGSNSGFRRLKHTTGDASHGMKKNIDVRKLREKIMTKDMKEPKISDSGQASGSNSPVHSSGTKRTAQKESIKKPKKVHRRRSSGDGNIGKKGPSLTAHRKPNRSSRTAISSHSKGDDVLKSPGELGTLSSFDLDERGNRLSLDSSPPTMPGKPKSVRISPDSTTTQSTSSYSSETHCSRVPRFTRKGNQSPVPLQSTVLFNSLPASNPDDEQSDNERVELTEASTTPLSSTSLNSKICISPLGSPKRPMINFRKKSEKSEKSDRSEKRRSSQLPSIDTHSFDSEGSLTEIDEAVWDSGEDLQFLRGQFTLLENRLLESENEVKELTRRALHNEKRFTAEVVRLKMCLGTVDQAQEIRYHSLLEVFTDNFRTLGSVEARFEQMLGVRQIQILKLGLVRYFILRILDFLAAILFWSIQVISFSYKLFSGRGRRQVAAKLGT